MCIFEGCKISPNFNYEGQTKRLYCAAHKLEGMVNVRKKKTCIYEGCEKTPCFNYKGKTQGIYCGVHKLEEMVNIKDKSCIYEGCETRPSYNIEGNTNALYCFKHKLDKMVNVKKKKCIYKGCEMSPSYNIKGKTKALYCSKHKLENMIDVIHTTCIHKGCETIPTFNKIGESIPLYCIVHKLNDMINVKKKTCIFTDCQIQPSYNTEGSTQALYCMKHKLDGMVYVLCETCITPNCPILIKNNKYDGYCLYCYMHLFPDKPVTRNYKTKEFSVVSYIKNTLPDYTWIQDKSIKDGCSRHRPDLIVDFGEFVIIIEIDEDKHIDYSCENLRLMKLSQDLGHRPLIVIRFNPDKYINESGKKISSCWELNKKGICVIKKTKKKEWEQRLNVLVENINYWIDPINKPTKTIEIVNLFYDV